MKTKFDIYNILFVLLLPICMYGQITWNDLPQDLELVPRNVASNEGVVSFLGNVDNSSNYSKIKIEVLRDGSSYATYEQNLNYSGGNSASFEINPTIVAEEFNYSFVVSLRLGGTYSTVTLPNGYGNNVVAGDVYIIQGQSNAVASIKDGSSASSSQNDFIRVYSGGNELISNVQSDDFWYIANVNGGNNSSGNSGQWGAKLADLLIDNEHIPIAIFNGAKGGKIIDYFFENYSGSLDDDPDSNNYERLKYRLDKTGLADDVKAIFWSQGENVSNSVSFYKSGFLSLVDSWIGNGGSFGDFPNVEQIYIFQTINGCNAYSNGNFYRLMYSKEAQRQLAEENSNIQIINTDGLKHSSDLCHFIYDAGYEGFAERVYPLVLRDFYNGPAGTDYESPNITGAYLTDDVTLVVQTDASSLSMNNPTETIKNFELVNAGSSLINDVTVSEGQIIFSLSEYPGSNATIRNLGAVPGVQDYLITNGGTGPEILSFDHFPIDASQITIWSNSLWNNGAPTQTMNAIINENFSVLGNDLTTKNLKVKSGVALDFNGGTAHSIKIYGDLLVDGSLTVGDTESLIINNPNATVTVNGTFTKKEKTTQLESNYDVTYWSTPVSNTSFNSVFVSNGVDANRIFYYNSKQENPNYTGNYDKYRHWFNIENVSDLITPGQGYSVDGANNGGYPKQMEFNFIGTPNYQNITVQIGTFDPHDDDDVNKVNLLGNPYPSAIEASELINQNLSNFNGALYFWTHAQAYESGEYNAADYLTYTLTGPNDSQFQEPYYIASGQGFMILTDKLNTDFEFTNDMQRAGGNNQFFKSGKSKKGNLTPGSKNRIWIEIEKDQVLRKEILIGFTDLATDDYDKGYDGKLINNDPVITFYSLIKEDKYAVQGLGGNPINKKIDLGFSTKEGGRFKIGISKKEGILNGYKIILRDRKLNLNHDLNRSDYFFNENEIGDFTDRFVLKFKNEKSQPKDEIDTSPSFSVVNSERGFSFKCSKKLESVSIYDIFGRLLYKSNPNKRNFILTTDRIKKGTFVIINAQVKDGKVFIRKRIKY